MSNADPEYRSFFTILLNGGQIALEENVTGFDGVTIGGGHNALTCAAYLARAPLSVVAAEEHGGTPATGGRAERIPPDRGGVVTGAVTEDPGPAGRWTPIPAPRWSE